MPHNRPEKVFQSGPSGCFAAAADAIARVAIVDDHPMLCAGVAETFSADPRFIVVGIGGCAGDAERIVRDEMPDLLVIDINMPGDGLAAVANMAQEHPAMRILVLSAFGDDRHLLRAFTAGAHGYLVKGVAGEELLSAARKLLEGEHLVPAEIAARIVEETRRSARRSIAFDVPLTAREQEILELIAEGRSNSEIAMLLGLAEQTVKNYLSNVLKKLQVRNRVEAVMAVLRSRQS